MPNDSAEPDPHGPPAFVLLGETEAGDKVRVEGRLGPPLPPSETDAPEEALSECVGADGRELVARLDIVTTIESGLSGEVTLADFALPPGRESETHLLDFLMGYGEGPECFYGTAPESTGYVNFGELQPHQPEHFTMWVVMLDAISPNDPKPSASTLAHQRWLMGLPQITVDEKPASATVSGNQIASCAPQPVENFQENPQYFLAIVKGTSLQVRPGDPDREELCYGEEE